MPRKAKQIEGVFEKNPGSGVWYVRYRSQGKLVRKAIGTKREAEAYVEKARTIRRDGKGVLPTTATMPIRTEEEVKLWGDGVTVNILCDQYEAHIMDDGNPDRPANPASVAQQIDVIRTTFGDRVANTVRPYEIKQWLHSMKLAPATLNKYKSTLSGVYSLAVEREMLEVNPCRSVKHFKVELGVPRWLSFEEEDKIRAVIDGWISKTPEHHRLTRLWLREHHNEITIAIGTALRKSNVYGLTWSMCDFDNRLLVIPKTKPGRPHVVAMTDDVLAALEDQRRIQDEITKVGRRVEVTEDTRGAAGDRVFSISENREWWKAAVKAAKIPHVRWHDLRHTSASRLAMAGANQKVIQTVLGHSTMAMSARYTHLHPDHLHAAMSALNRNQPTVAS